MLIFDVATSSAPARASRAVDDVKLPCEICQKAFPASKLDSHQNQCAALADRKRKLDELAFVKVAPVIDVGKEGRKELPDSRL